MATANRQSKNCASGRRKDMSINITEALEELERLASSESKRRIDWSNYAQVDDILLKFYKKVKQVKILETVRELFPNERWTIATLEHRYKRITE